MVMFLIDTSVWLGLAKDPKDAALLGVVERLVSEGLVQLIVPSVVFKEFLAHRERVAIDYGKRLSSHFRSVKEAVELSDTNPAEIHSVLRFLTDVDQKSGVRTKFATRTFDRIERLLKRGALVEPSDDVKLAAFERALARQAPFVQGENEMADAVIIETYAECVRRDSASEQRWIFVTRNTDHFSAGRGSEKNPHPDYTCFSTGKSDYFISLPNALRAVDSKLVAELLRAWELEQPTVGELIGRFIDEAPKDKPISSSQFYSLNSLRQRAIGQKVAAKLRPRDIVEHCRTRRADGIEPTTVRSDLNFLRSILNTAERDWEVWGVTTDPVDDALREVERLELVGHRNTLIGRRPTGDELRTLREYFRGLPTQGKYAPTIKIWELMEFAIASGRQIGEIHSLRWDGFNPENKTCTLRGKTFPVANEAVAIIERQSRSGKLIFPYKAKSAGQAFARAKRALKIVGLRFQDLRREAVARMLEAKVPLDTIEARTGLTALSLAKYREQLAGAEDAIPKESSIWKRRRRLRFSART